MNPSTDVLRELLGKVRTIAIVGAKDTIDQPVSHVGEYLINAGFEVFPVHPVRNKVWGRPACKSIGDLPGPVDVIDLFRAAEYCPDHAREVLTLPWKPLVFWMQLGISSPEATRIMEDAGIAVVQNACLMVEYRRIFAASHAQK